MNNMRILTWKEVLDQTKGKVLLINPPVIDTRYPWIKWNQPLDLLKLGTLLRENRGCQVKLFDFLLPNSKGNVPRRHSKIEENLDPSELTRWQFGVPWEKFDEYLDLLNNDKWIPDFVWITTLTSFWWQTIPLVADRVKNKLNRPLVVLYGNYAVLETDHAARTCFNIDIIVKEHINLSPWKTDFTLYGNQNIRFCALDMRSADPVSEIAYSVNRGITHFVFFNENLFSNFDNCLRPILTEIAKKDWDIRIHGICGVQIEDFPIEQAELLIDSHIDELHFDPYYKDNGGLDEFSFIEVMNACERVGYVSKRGSGWESTNRYSLSAFLWIGRRYENLEELVWNMLKLHQLVGMVIPKPFSPLPGSKDYKILMDKLGNVEPEDISPHRLPLSVINGISRNEYKDLYRLSALLNYKVRNRTFDFLGNSFLAREIRESIKLRRWDI